MTREKATKIVTDFLNDMNPDMWDGNGNKPESFDEHAWQYPLTDNVNQMKKEIIGYVGEYNDGWFFENEKESYSSNVPTAIDELLGIYSKDGDKFKITIEKLN